MSRKPRKARPAPVMRIILAAHALDGLEHAISLGWNNRFTVITGRDTARIRGREGAVYATPALSADTEQLFCLLLEAKPCGATVPWTDEQRADGRIA